MHPDALAVEPSAAIRIRLIRESAYTLTPVPKGRLDTDPTNVSDLQGARALSV
jgi:hypothetical protein